MVNRGRPSKDCLPCRKRKLRCDLRRDGCGQCRRANLRCSGYRDPCALIIHDETQRTQRKALVDGNVQQALPTRLQLAWDAQARAEFFAFYVFGVSRTHDALASLYEQAAPSSCLAESVDAASLAFMAHHHGHIPLLVLARSRYQKALQHVNKALRDPQLAVTDTTLQSVLLLDLYEKIVSRHSFAPVAWMAHVNGALALMESRGERNFNSHNARRLASRLATTLLISCVATCTRVPEGFMALHRGLGPYIDRSNAKWLAHDIVILVANLRAEIREGKFMSYHDILERAWCIEGEFAKMEKTLSPLWRCIRVEVKYDNPLIFGRSYDVYQDLYVTQGSHVFRILRLLLHDIIQSYANREPSPSDNRFEESCRITEDTARGTCTSVTQFILVEAKPENRVPFSPLQVLQCYAILPALFLAWQHSRDHKLRAWVLNVVKHMAEAGSMRMAKSVADAMESSPDLSYWEIYSMLGSYAFAA